MGDAGDAGVVGRDQQLPFFVYGTLMAGYENHKRRVEGLYHRLQADVSVRGMHLVHFGPPRGYPGVYHDRYPPLTEREGERGADAGVEAGAEAGARADAAKDEERKELLEVRGELLFFAADVYARALALMDDLEGYESPGHPHNMYEREQVTCHLPDGSTTAAWIYTCRINRAANNARPLPSGDWGAYARTLPAKHIGADNAMYEL